MFFADVFRHGERICLRGFGNGIFRILSYFAIAISTLYPISNIWIVGYARPGPPGRPPKLSIPRKVRAKTQRNGRGSNEVATDAERLAWGRPYRWQ